MKRNITIIMQPKVAKVLDKLYEQGLINSRTQIYEIAIFEWLRKNKLI